MWANVSADRLGSALGAAIRGVSARTKIPVLGCTWLQAADGVLKVCGTDLDVVVEKQVPAQVDQPGTAVVPAQRLHDLVAGLPGDEDVALATTRKALDIVTGRARFALPRFDENNYPPTLALDPEVTRRVWIVNGDDIAGIVGTAVARCVDGSRPYLSGTALTSDGGQLSAVSSDGHRLLRFRTTAADTDGHAIIIPAPTVALIGRLFSKSKAVTITTDGRKVRIEADDVCVTSRLIDANFPDWTRVLPPVAANTALLAAGALRDAIRRALAIYGRASEDAARVLLGWKIDGGRLDVRLTNGDGAAAESLQATVTGAVETAIDPELLLPLLDAFGDADVQLSCAESRQPMRFDMPGGANVLAMLAARA